MIPPFTGVAVKITIVPAQTGGVADDVMETLTAAATPQHVVSAGS